MATLAEELREESKRLSMRVLHQRIKGRTLTLAEADAVCRLADQILKGHPDANLHSADQTPAQ